MLTQMSPGGRWMKPPHDGPAVYVPAKQVEAHIKRLVGDNWMPIEDPRRDDEPVQWPSHLNVGEMAGGAISPREVAMQSQIDQLTALVQQLIAQKEQDHASTQHDEQPDSENTPDDRRSSRRKPAISGSGHSG